MRANYSESGFQLLQRRLSKVSTVTQCLVGSKSSVFPVPSHAPPPVLLCGWKVQCRYLWSPSPFLIPRGIQAGSEEWLLSRYFSRIYFAHLHVSCRHKSMTNAVPVVIRRTTDVLGYLFSRIHQRGRRLNFACSRLVIRLTPNTVAGNGSTRSWEYSRVVISKSAVPADLVFSV